MAIFAGADDEDEDEARLLVSRAFNKRAMAL